MVEFVSSNAERECEVYGYDSVVASHCRIPAGVRGRRLPCPLHPLRRPGGDPAPHRGAPPRARAPVAQDGRMTALPVVCVSKSL